MYWAQPQSRDEASVWDCTPGKSVVPAIGQIDTVVNISGSDLLQGGDNVGAKYATGAFFVFLWFMYILLNILNLYFHWMGFPDDEESVSPTVVPDGRL